MSCSMILLEILSVISPGFSDKTVYPVVCFFFISLFLFLYVHLNYSREHV